MNTIDGLCDRIALPWLNDGLAQAAGMRVLLSAAVSAVSLLAPLCASLRTHLYACLRYSSRMDALGWILTLLNAQVQSIGQLGRSRKLRQSLSAYWTMGRSAR